MATRSVGKGSGVGLIFTVFLLTGIKALLLISWFNWITFSLDLTSHIQTPTYYSISPSRPQLSFSAGPEDIFRNLISRGSEADGTGGMCAWGRVCRLLKELAGPGSGCLGAQGIRTPLPVFRQEAQACSSGSAAGEGGGQRAEGRGLRLSTAGPVPVG